MQMVLGFLKKYYMIYQFFSSRRISNECKNTNLKRYIQLYVHCSTIYNYQNISNLSVHQGWIVTEYMIYIHKVSTTWYYSTIKKKEILLFIKKWMGLKGVMLSEVNQRQISYNFASTWNIFLKRNKQNKTKMVI